ncbi:bifunctional DNA-formamidopyrimidine glycosylase/DNA-(apurinic or apyrimidinic site) lyase [soil metagenome]
MPELPEIETLRRDIDRDVVGKRVKAAEVMGMNAVRRHPNKKQFAQKLMAVKITGVERQGLLLVCTLDSGDALVIRLGSSGRLLRVAAKVPVDGDTQVVITFTQGGQLRFIDPVESGELFVISADDLLSEVPEVAALGVDPVDEPMSWTTFGRLLVTNKGKLKAVLMDHSVISGLGPVYSDEILFAAGLRHDRSSDALSTQEIRRLYRAVVETLHEALKHRGSTLRDGYYTDLHGKPGDFNDQHQVYERDGLACRRCRAVLVKTKFGGRPAYSCTQCQM